MPCVNFGLLFVLRNSAEEHNVALTRQQRPQHNPRGTKIQHINFGPPPPEIIEQAKKHAPRNYYEPREYYEFDFLIALRYKCGIGHPGHSQLCDNIK